MQAVTITSLKPVWIVLLCLVFLCSWQLGAAKVKKGDKAELFPALAVNILPFVDRDGQSLNESGKVVYIGVYDRNRNRRVFKTFEGLCDKQPERYMLYDLSEAMEEEVVFDLIYIASDKSDVLPMEILDYFSDKAVLVVGEHDELLEAGGIVRFRTSEGKKAELGINLKQAKLVGLSIRSQLLRRATELIR
ncbi:YfiR family protein [Pelagicoccus mobilis]|uniref:YfiR family protein n=1 Tax=Pelagicoccus mobilis TaxID=415221 RepID=A0A934RXY5_9BACT|nr:YfiR family protein [Pelagicoccus mobilis]MBK1877289.1 YfiR family protein [Pelagicoccus mobilis]